jgi:glycosyltransferase involved in cell wall biosynthesis
MRILSLTKYGTLAASTRQRFLQYEPLLAEAGITVEYSALLGNEHLRRLVEGKAPSLLGTAVAYAQRLRRLLGPRNYDLLWVHCELFPYLPGVSERLSLLSGKPVLYDFDDAIFHMYDESPHFLIKKLLGGKLAPLLRGASACSCGNAYLKNYAERYCPTSFILPTVVDTEIYRPEPREKGSVPVIGWIGSPSTWHFVRPYLPLLAALAARHGARIRIVGAGAAAREDGFPGLDLIEWSEETEVSDVQAMDIGIMPLPDEPWARGKSGYKLIQYMACGLPVVASPVGVNREIVLPDETGYLASDLGQWETALSRLIESPDLRRRMGDAGRTRAVAEYSLATHGPRLIELLLRLVQNDRKA